MKKPIKFSQILAGGLYCSLLLLLLSINFLPSKDRKPNIDFSSMGKANLVLSDSIVSSKKYIDYFEFINISTQFVDSIELIPSEKSFIEIKGDQTLVNNLKISSEGSALYVMRKHYYPIAGIEDDGFYQTNHPGSLDQGGLFIRVGYKDLRYLYVFSEVKKIKQQGTIKGDKVTINVIAELAQFNVEAKHLYLDITKPEIHVNLGSLDGKKYNSSLLKLKHSPLHVVKGKADLVEMSTYRYGTTMTDLSQLQCRHVHADFRFGGQYKSVIAAPTQLFSYITSRKEPSSDIKMICKSKAKVTRAYQAAKRIARYR